MSNIGYIFQEYFADFLLVGLMLEAAIFYVAYEPRGATATSVATRMTTVAQYGASVFAGMTAGLAMVGTLLATRVVTWDSEQIPMALFACVFWSLLAAVAWAEQSRLLRRSVLLIGIVLVTMCSAGPVVLLHSTEGLHSTWLFLFAGACGAGVAMVNQVTGWLTSGPALA
jgi:hypothetical protein